jgi:hypothetical protein
MRPNPRCARELESACGHHRGNRHTVRARPPGAAQRPRWRSPPRIAFAWRVCKGAQVTLQPKTVVSGAGGQCLKCVSAFGGDESCTPDEEEQVRCTDFLLLKLHATLLNALAARCTRRPLLRITARPRELAQFCAREDPAAWCLGVEAAAINATGARLGLGRIVALCDLLIHFIPESLTYSVPLFLKRQCDRTLGARGSVGLRGGCARGDALVRPAAGGAVICSRLSCLVCVEHRCWDTQGGAQMTSPPRTGSAAKASFAARAAAGRGAIVLHTCSVLFFVRDSPYGAKRPAGE